jgi:hypothetical protein
MYEALAQLRRDLVRLEKGIQIKMHPDGAIRTVRCLVAQLNADSVQVSANCGHLGNAAIKNCPFCMVSKGARAVFTKGILDWRMTRTDLQSQVIRAYMAEVLGSHPTKKLVEELRKLFGITELDHAFDGVADPHRQSIPCIGHLIDLGLMARLLDAMLLQIISQGHIAILEARLDAFLYPRTWDRFSTKVVLLKGRKMKPMTLSRKLALAATSLFQGLVDPYLLELVNGLLSLRGAIMNKHHTDATIKEAQEEGEKWVEAALSYARCVRTLRMDLPNMHLLIEVLLRFLPLVRDMHSGMTSMFEAKHQGPKQLIQRVKQNQTASPENYALQQSTFVASFRHLANGLRWGPRLQHEAGPKLRELLNHRNHEGFHLPNWLLPPSKKHHHPVRCLLVFKKNILLSFLFCSFLG